MPAQQLLSVFAFFRLISDRICLGACIEQLFPTDAMPYLVACIVQPVLSSLGMHCYTLDEVLAMHSENPHVHLVLCS